MPDTPLLGPVNLAMQLAQKLKGADNKFKKLIEAAARGSIHVDNDPRTATQPLVSTAFNTPNAPKLPDQPLRPTSLTKFRDQPFKSLRSHLPNKIILPDSLANKDVDSINYPYKLPQNEVWETYGDQETPTFFGDPAPLPLVKQLSLGNATLSLGKDKDRPYLSIFDSYDFAPGAGELNSIKKWFLQRATQPFNVYDRIPIEPYVDPDNRRRLPRVIENSQDVNLERLVTQLKR